MEEETIVLYMVRYRGDYVKYFKHSYDAITKVRISSVALYWLKIKIPKSQYKKLIIYDKIDY